MRELGGAVAFPSRLQLSVFSCRSVPENRTVSAAAIKQQENLLLRAGGGPLVSMVELL